MCSRAVIILVQIEECLKDFLHWPVFLLPLHSPTSFEECIRWARLKFEDYFVNRIVQLTFLYPIDAKTKADLPFWTLPKRFPEVVKFDPDDEMCMQFIIAASNLRAKVKKNFRDLCLRGLLEWDFGKNRFLLPGQAICVP